jgi:acetolactate synthase-1/2/3 large subunit
MLGGAASRPRSTAELAQFVLRCGIPYFTTQMGKGTVPGGAELYMGTAALSERDYVHEAIERADLIITIGHDTIEKPPFIMDGRSHASCMLAIYLRASSKSISLRRR